ncbi:extracellular matrix regulator RemB [Fusobacterium sp.]|uniref:extracellular matrix regulator RemB n=1 Tax=Fusobacterium sp. TaxID=68766 RepID=UPI00396C823B
MYLFLDDDVVIPNEKIVLIIDCIHFNSPENIEFYSKELEKKELVNLAKGTEKSVIITDDKVYISSYGTQTLIRRAKEFFSIVGGI